MLDKTVLVATSAIGLGAVTVFTVPAALSLSRLRNRGSKFADGIYEDEDGKSTLDAVKAFSNKASKAAIVVFSLIGLGVSITLAVISTLATREGFEGGLFLENWLAVPFWVSKLVVTHKTH